MPSLARYCSHDRHNVFPFWDLCFVSWRRHESMLRFRLSSPTLSCMKRGDSKLNLVFNKTKNSFLILRDAIMVLSACTAVVRPLFCVGGCIQTIARNNEQGGNTFGHLSHCIRVKRPGFSLRDISSRRDCLLGPAPIRSRPEEVRKAQLRL